MKKVDLQKALEFYSKSLEIATQLKDSLGISTAYNNVGYLYNRIGQPEKALQNYSKSLEITLKLNQVDASTQHVE